MRQFGNTVRYTCSGRFRIETRRQYVAKASAILDRFGSPFWDVPDNPIRSAGTSRSIARISRINRIDPTNGTQPNVQILTGCHRQQEFEPIPETCTGCPKLLSVGDTPTDGSQAAELESVLVTFRLRVACYQL